MAEFKLFGRFIALSEVKEIASTEAGKAPIKKRELYMDCTRIDYYTKQPIGQENKVVLEFGGEKILDKLKALNLQKDDIIAVDFNIVGTPYKDKTTGKNRVFTSIRCYDVTVEGKAGQAVANTDYHSNHQPTGEQPAQGQDAAPVQSAPVMAPTQQPQTNPLPPADNGAPAGTDNVLPF